MNETRTGAPPTQRIQAVQRAHEIFSETPLIDGHNDLAWAMRQLCWYDLDQTDLGTQVSETHTDLVRLRAGGVGAQFWSVYAPSSSSDGDAAVITTLEQIDFVRALIARFSDQLGLATSAREVEQIFATGRIASLLGAEGGHSIGCSMGVLRQLYELGVRYLTLTHGDNVPWADSATDVPRLGGLDDFGRQVVQEMNRLGMLVDLSHVSVATMHDALDTTVAPVIFSHSSCRALVDHPRNVPDDVLARLPENGGVCMISFVPEFVSAQYHAWVQAAEAKLEADGYDPREWMTHLDVVATYERENPRPTATISQVADNIEHARSVAGIAHVGIGSDYDGCDVFPEGLADVSTYPFLFAELLDRGWSEADCALLAGGNVLRALRQAETVADELRQSRRPSLARLTPG